MAAASRLALRAVVSGATGATGQCLVGELLKAKTFEKVIVLGRRKMTIPEMYGLDQEAEEASKRFEQRIVDFDELNEETGKEHFAGAHVFFCCLGTTKARCKTLPGDWKENFRKVDYHLLLNLAGYAKSAGVRHISVVSSAGAHSGSMFFYLRTKGETDDKVAGMEFDRASIYRPGFLRRYGNTDVMYYVAWMVRGLPTERLAKAMRAEAETYAEDSSKFEKVQYLANSDIYAILATDDQKDRAAAAAAAAAAVAQDPGGADSAPSQEEKKEPEGAPAKESEPKREEAAEQTEQKTIGEVQEGKEEAKAEEGEKGDGTKADEGTAEPEAQPSVPEEIGASDGGAAGGGD